jgi:tryptophan halogenase
VIKAWVTHEAGWTWDIGLHNRRGIGYVYFAAHSTDDRAESVLRALNAPGQSR